MATHFDFLHHKCAHLNCYSNCKLKSINTYYSSLIIYSDVIKYIHFYLYSISKYQNYMVNLFNVYKCTTSQDADLPTFQNVFKILFYP